MKSLLSATVLFAALAAGAHAAEIGKTIAVDCPINDCDKPVSLIWGVGHASRTALDTSGYRPRLFVPRIAPSCRTILLSLARVASSGRYFALSMLLT